MLFTEIKFKQDSYSSLDISYTFIDSLPIYKLSKVNHKYNSAEKMERNDLSNCTRMKYRCSDPAICKLTQ